MREEVEDVWIEVAMAGLSGFCWRNQRRKVVADGEMRK